MSSPDQKPFILVDGSAYLYRAFHAMPSLSSPQGEPTGAIKGVMNMLQRILKDYAPTHIAVVFDAPGKTFRDELYNEYKANRAAMPDDLVAQIVPLHALVRAAGFPLLHVPGVEADDVIGTLAIQAHQAGMQTLISTGDKDFAQLVRPGIQLLNTMNNTLLDHQGVLAKFGVAPEQIIDYLSLMGDKSDNVPGVPKVGPKTAARWLQKYGSVSEIIRHAEEIKGKVGESLRAHLAQIPLSQQLCTIRQDVPLEQSPQTLRMAEPDQEALEKWYKRLGFSTQLAALADQGQDEKQSHFQWETVFTEAALDAWLVRLQSAPLFAFDTETTSLDYMEAQLVGLSFAISPELGVYVPCGHRYPDAPAQLDRNVVLAKLKPLLEDSTVRKVGQNLKYDRSILRNHDIDLRGIAHDTMLQSYVLNSTASQHNLDSLSLQYLGHKTIHFEEVAGKGSKQVSFDQVAIEQAAPYAAEDAVLTLQLHQYFWPLLQESERLAALYQQIEIPLIPVLSRMERHGVLIDAAMLQAQTIELAARIEEIEKECHHLAGESFNLSSPKQIREILFDRLKLPVLRKTPKKEPSTAEDVLQELALDYPLPKHILEHRGLIKLKSTYTERLPEQVNPRTGRIHTSYHQAVAATGRLSSSTPNLQNIPIRSAEGRRIRQAFIAPPGFCLLAADYSQIELRIMAHLSHDQGLLQAFASGQDIHRRTAAEIFGVPPEEISTAQRRSAKAINFGLIYGMSAFGLAKQLQLSRKNAQHYVDRYFEHYPGIQQYMEEMRQQAHAQGYVETIFGRRLYLPEINSRNRQRRLYAERTAINAPMQGTAADIIKRAMLQIDAWIEKEAPPLRMTMQVHDELVFEIAESKVAELTPVIRQYMCAAANMKVPLLVDIGTGQNWEEAH